MISAIGSVTHTFGSQPVAKTGATGASGITAGADFSKVLADVASSAVDTLRAGEAASIGGINGTRTTQQVVEAVMNAEQALQRHDYRTARRKAEEAHAQAVTALNLASKATRP